MQYIAIEDLERIAKDVTLENGAKHRCIDATQIYELPKVDLIRCKDCIYFGAPVIGYTFGDCKYRNWYPTAESDFCSRAKRR